MTDHRWHGPKDHTNPNDSETCQACVLDVCEVCKAVEAELPTECPGVKMTWEQLKAVQDGTLDYRGGRWISKS